MRYGTITEYTFDLTSPQKQLCAWVAEQASVGAGRITYGQACLALDIPGDREVTSLLRGIRERLDDVHNMVQFPIVNTAMPYFDIHPNADYIWDAYCQAEREHFGLDQACSSDAFQDSDYAQRDLTACCV